MTTRTTPIHPPALHHGVSQQAPHKHRHAFSQSHVSMGVMVHMAGMIVGVLATDKMKEPSARWATIAGFGVATGIGEAIWRDHIEREREEREQAQTERS